MIESGKPMGSSYLPIACGPQSPKRAYGASQGRRGPPCGRMSVGPWAERKPARRGDSGRVGTGQRFGIRLWETRPSIHQRDRINELWTISHTLRRQALPAAARHLRGRPSVLPVAGRRLASGHQRSGPRDKSVEVCLQPKDASAKQVRSNRSNASTAQKPACAHPAGRMKGWQGIAAPARAKHPGRAAGP